MSEASILAAPTRKYENPRPNAVPILTTKMHFKRVYSRSDKSGDTTV